MLVTVTVPLLYEMLTKEKSELWGIGERIQRSYLYTLPEFVNLKLLLKNEDFSVQWCHQDQNRVNSKLTSSCQGCLALKS